MHFLLIACIASDGTELAVGETQVLNGVQRECVPRNGWVDYFEYQHNGTNIQYLPSNL